VAVPRHLRDRVAAIDVVVADPTTAPAPVLPTSAVVLGVQRHGRLRGPDGLLSVAGVTGLIDTARRYAPEGPTTSILVRFTPTGASSLGVPVSELSNMSLGLDDVVAAARVRSLRQRVADAGSDEEAVAAVVEFVAGCAIADDAAIDAAVAALDEEGARVAAVAAAVGLSERQLERRFLARVGQTPKQWQSLRRFERAVAAAATTSLTTAALDAGYFDQAHFNREFRRRTGVAPGALLR
jgi:AraC-like DNA-binding protein